MSFSSYFRRVVDLVVTVIKFQPASHLQLKTAGSNVLFAAVTEVSDSILRGAETNGFNGVVRLKSLLIVSQT